MIDPEAIDWSRIRRVTVVCTIEDDEVDDGVLVALYRSGDRWGVPSGERLPHEDAWDDTVLRVPMSTMGFRRQATHPVAVDEDGLHVVFVVDGGRYTGDRLSGVSVEWWTGPVAEAVALLSEQGDEALAAHVDTAVHAYRTLPYERRAADVARTLVGPYLRATTPEGGSGFGGSAEEWREARGVLLDAVDPTRRAIRFLDHACANGLLAVSMRTWAGESGIALDPYGVDIAPQLVSRARADHPELADRFFVGDALTWRHPDGARFDLVHVLLDVVPARLHRQLVQHQLDEVVAMDGRLVVSQYGDPPSSRSAEELLSRAGFAADGQTRQPMRLGRPRGFPSVWIDA